MGILYYERPFGINDPVTLDRDVFKSMGSFLVTSAPLFFYSFSFRFLVKLFPDRKKVTTRYSSNDLRVILPYIGRPIVGAVRCRSGIHLSETAFH